MTTYTGSIQTFSAGTKLTAAGLQTVTDSLHALDDAWTSYTPTWSSTSGTPPAINNGSITGKYIQLGKLVICRGQILMGSLTTYGSGGVNWTLTFPVTPLDAKFSGAVMFVDSSDATQRRGGSGLPNGTSNMTFYANGGFVGPTVPFTWATNDSLNWDWTYEAA